MTEPPPLPTAVERLLNGRPVSPRLRAHLRLVHGTASRLVQGVRAAWPNISLDDDAVLFGAATHDIGKVAQSEELSGPSHAHERAGVRLLLERGVADFLFMVDGACKLSP